MMNDTSPEAERVLIDSYRRMPPARKWQIMRGMYSLARALHAAGVCIRNPKATDREIVTAWIRDNLGFTDFIPRQEPEMASPPADVLHELRAMIRICEQLGLRYVLGGSMMFSIFGICRYTRTVDITVEGMAGREQKLVDALAQDYYISADAVRHAVDSSSSFNMIHYLSGLSVDVFIPSEQPFEHSALSRRISVLASDDLDDPLFVYTPEDLILFRLRWYRLGKIISEQHWKDILGVFRVQGDRLDQAYLDHWGAELTISDLVHRARKESAL